MSTASVSTRSIRDADQSSKSRTAAFPPSKLMPAEVAGCSMVDQGPTRENTSDMLLAGISIFSSSTSPDAAATFSRAAMSRTPQDTIRHASGLSISQKRVAWRTFCTVRHSLLIPSVELDRMVTLRLEYLPARNRQFRIGYGSWRVRPTPRDWRGSQRACARCA